MGRRGHVSARSQEKEVKQAKTAEAVVVNLKNVFKKKICGDIFGTSLNRDDSMLGMMYHARTKATSFEPIRRDSVSEENQSAELSLDGIQSTEKDAAESSESDGEISYISLNPRQQLASTIKSWSINPENDEHLLKEGGVHALVALAGFDDHGLKGSVAEALYNLSKRAGNRNELLNIGAANALISIGMSARSWKMARICAASLCHLSMATDGGEAILAKAGVGVGLVFLLGIRQNRLFPICVQALYNLTCVSTHFYGLERIMKGLLTLPVLTQLQQQNIKFISGGAAFDPITYQLRALVNCARFVWMRERIIEDGFLVVFSALISTLPTRTNQSELSLLAVTCLCFLSEAKPTAVEMICKEMIELLQQLLPYCQHEGFRIVIKTMRSLLKIVNTFSVIMYTSAVNIVADLAHLVAEDVVAMQYVGSCLFVFTQDNLRNMSKLCMRVMRALPKLFHSVDALTQYYSISATGNLFRTLLCDDPQFLDYIVLQFIEAGHIVTDKMGVLSFCIAVARLSQDTMYLNVILQNRKLSWVLQLMIRLINTYGVLSLIDRETIESFNCSSAYVFAIQECCCVAICRFAMHLDAIEAIGCKDDIAAIMFRLVRECSVISPHLVPSVNSVNNSPTKSRNRSRKPSWMIANERRFDESPTFNSSPNSSPLVSRRKTLSVDSEPEPEKVITRDRAVSDNLTSAVMSYAMGGRATAITSPSGRSTSGGIDQPPTPSRARHTLSGTPKGLDKFKPIYDDEEGGDDASLANSIAALSEIVKFSGKGSSKSQVNLEDRKLTLEGWNALSACLGCILILTESDICYQELLGKPSFLTIIATIAFVNQKNMAPGGPPQPGAPATSGGASTAGGSTAGAVSVQPALSRTQSDAVSIISEANGDEEASLAESVQRAVNLPLPRRCCEILAIYSYDSASFKEFSTANMMKILLSIAKSEDLVIRELIATVLCNISTDTRAQSLMVDLDIAEVLASLSSSTNELLQELCARCICNLSSNSELHGKLIKRGVLQTLLMISLVRSVSVVTKRLAARAMLNFTAVEENLTSILGSGIVGGFATLMGLNDPEIRMICAEGVLAISSSSVTGRTALCQRASVLHSIFASLKTGMQGNLTNIVGRCVCNILAAPESRQAAVNAGALSVLKVIATTKSSKLRDATTRLVMTLINDKSLHVHLLREPIVSVLIYIIEDAGCDDAESLESAIRAFSCLAQQQLFRGVLIEKGCISSLTGVVLNGRVTTYAITEEICRCFCLLSFESNLVENIVHGHALIALYCLHKGGRYNGKCSQMMAIILRNLSYAAINFDTEAANAGLSKNTDLPPITSPRMWMSRQQEEVSANTRKTHVCAKLVEQECLYVLSWLIDDCKVTESRGSVRRKSTSPGMNDKNIFGQSLVIFRCACIVLHNLCKVASLHHVMIAQGIMSIAYKLTNKGITSNSALPVFAAGVSPLSPSVNSKTVPTQILSQSDIYNIATCMNLLSQSASCRLSMANNQVVAILDRMVHSEGTVSELTYFEVACTLTNIASDKSCGEALANNGALTLLVTIMNKSISVETQHQCSLALSYLSEIKAVSDGVMSSLLVLSLRLDGVEPSVSPTRTGASSASVDTAHTGETANSQRSRMSFIDDEQSEGSISPMRKRRNASDMGVSGKGHEADNSSISSKSKATEVSAALSKISSTYSKAESRVGALKVAVLENLERTLAQNTSPGAKLNTGNLLDQRGMLNLAEFRAQVNMPSHAESLSALEEEVMQPAATGFQLMRRTNVVNDSTQYVVYRTVDEGYILGDVSKAAKSDELIFLTFRETTNEATRQKYLYTIDVYNASMSSGGYCSRIERDTALPVLNENIGCSQSAVVVNKNESNDEDDSILSFTTPRKYEQTTTNALTSDRLNELKEIRISNDPLPKDLKMIDHDLLMVYGKRGNGDLLSFCEDTSSIASRSKGDTLTIETSLPRLDVKEKSSKSLHHTSSVPALQSIRKHKVPKRGERRSEEMRTKSRGSSDRNSPLDTASVVSANSSFSSITGIASFADSSIAGLSSVTNHPKTKGGRSDLSPYALGESKSGRFSRQNSNQTGPPSTSSSVDLLTHQASFGKSSALTRLPSNPGNLSHQGSKKTKGSFSETLPPI